MYELKNDPHTQWERAERRADRIMRGLDPDPVERPAEQLPLFPLLPRAEPYPVNALGPALAPAARAIASKVQIPDAIAANSVLAAASLAVQAHADVRLPFGQTRPTSLFLLSIAGSGDRKTTADRDALQPVLLREKSLQELYKEQHRSYSIAYAAWAAEKRKIENNRKLDFEGRKYALTMLGPEPEPPLHPFLVVPDPTYEGLVKAWPTAFPSLGVFSAEGGQFIGGHGLSPDNRLGTATGFSELWDGHVIKRVRALDGVSRMQRRGPHPSDALNETFIRLVRAPAFYADGKGLYLRVDNTGAKRWILRTMVQGKRRDLGLGSLATTTLAEARQKASACRTITRQGGDPTKALRPIPQGIVDGNDLR